MLSGASKALTTVSCLQRNPVVFTLQVKPQSSVHRAIASPPTSCIEGSYEKKNLSADYKP